MGEDIVQKVEEKKPILFIDMDETIVDFLGSEALRSWDGKRNPPQMYEPGFFRNLQPLTGAKSAMYALIQSEMFDIYILTKPVSKSPDSYKEKVEWIASHFPDLLDKVIMTQNKLLMKGDILVDDDRTWKDFQGIFLHFNRNVESAIMWQKIVSKLLSGKWKQENKG